MNKYFIAAFSSSPSCWHQRRQLPARSTMGHVPTRPAALVAHSIGLVRLLATNRQRTAQAALFVTSRMLAQELPAEPTLPPMWLAFCRLAHLVSRESTDTLVGILTTPYTVGRLGLQSSRPRRCAKPRPKASCLESRT